MNHIYKNYPRFINILDNVISSIYDQISRDYRELEHLQSGKLAPINFAIKSEEIITSIIIRKIIKMIPRAGISVNSIEKKESQDGIYVHITPIDGIDNLCSALPFISTNIHISKNKDSNDKNNIIASIISVPILNLFFWSHENKSYEKNNLIKPRKFKSNINQEININNLSIELCLLASGKIDFIKKKYNHLYMLNAAIHIAEKSGIEIKIDNSKNIILAATPNILKSII